MLVSGLLRVNNYQYNSAVRALTAPMLSDSVLILQLLHHRILHYHPPLPASQQQLLLLPTPPTLLLVRPLVTASLIHGPTTLAHHPRKAIIFVALGVMLPARPQDLIEVCPLQVVEPYSTTTTSALSRKLHKLLQVVTQTPTQVGTQTPTRPQHCFTLAPPHPTHKHNSQDATFAVWYVTLV